jgi:hypothetical protein
MTETLSEHPKYVLRFFFEWHGGCLWPGNEAAYRNFELGPLDLEPTRLPLSAQTVQRCAEMAAWHDTSLNWDYPPHPGPWRQSECDQFNAAVRVLLIDIKQELGPDFEIVSQQGELNEDPDLDRYLADPNRFRR